MNWLLLFLPDQRSKMILKYFFLGKNIPDRTPVCPVFCRRSRQKGISYYTSSLSSRRLSYKKTGSSHWTSS